MNEKNKITEFIQNENAYQVMGELRRLGVLSKEDISHAMTLDRQGWLKFMKEKAGVADGTEDETV